MNNNPIKAVLFGATGLAGSGVLQECVKHPDVVQVTVISRRHCGIQHEKLREIIHNNFLDYTNIKENIAGHNTCFWCLGVSQVKVRDENKYREITVDYTISAAKVLTEMNQDISFCFLSGMGTDPTMQSRQMWARVKGEAEKGLEDIPFKKFYIFRPGYIHPTGKVKHPLFFGRMAKPFYPLANKLFPAYVTTNEELGLAMINAVLFNLHKKVFENKDIRELANR